MFTTRFDRTNPPASPAGEEDELKDSEALDHFSQVCQPLYLTTQFDHVCYGRFLHNLNFR